MARSDQVAEVAFRQKRRRDSMAHVREIMNQWSKHAKLRRRVRILVGRKIISLDRSGVSGCFFIWSEALKEVKKHDVRVQKQVLRLMRHVAKGARQIMNDCFEKWFTSTIREKVERERQEKEETRERDRATKDRRRSVTTAKRVVGRMLRTLLLRGYRTWWSNIVLMRGEELSRAHQKTKIKNILLRVVRARLSDGFLRWLERIRLVIVKEKRASVVIERTRALLGRLTHGKQSQVWNAWTEYVVVRARAR